ncbi:MAG: hypothetical protein ACPIOQ_21225, partial [Promethearchaeia archaeon]
GVDAPKIFHRFKHVDSPERLLSYIANEEAYDAEEAGLIFDITNSSQSSPCCGLRLTFKGYNDKMAALITNVIKSIVDLDIPGQHLSTFELLKEKTVMDYRNRRFQQVRTFVCSRTTS